MQEADSLLSQILERLTSIETRLPAPPPKRPPLQLDATLIDSFLRWSSREKRNSKAWVRRQRTYLEWWADTLADRNLRELSVADDLLPPLDAQPGRTQKIAVIKRLFSWLRKVRHQLAPAEDPTFGALSVPQSTPAQEHVVKAIVRKHYLAVRPHLRQRWRDALDLLAATGWHCTELERFIRGGATKGRVLLCPRSKAGGALRTRVSGQILAAAKRLHAQRTWSEKAFRTNIARACERARKTLIRPGRMRHSVATYAQDKGEQLGAIADFLNHQSGITTKRFYATHGTAKKIRNLHDG